jgi:cytoskeletal protein RodZ
MKVDTQALGARRPELAPSKRRDAGEAPSGDATSGRVVPAVAHEKTERAPLAAKAEAAGDEPEPLPAKARSWGRTLIVAAAALAIAGIWLLTQRDAPRTAQAPAQSPTPRSQLEPAAPLAPGPRVVEPAPAAEPAAPSNVPSDPTTAAQPAAPQQTPPAPAAAEAAAAPGPSTGAPANPDAASASSATGKVTVVVKVRPPEARLYYRGKEVGMSPVTIELAPGEKRAFEVGKRGYITRRLVLDGTQTNVFIGLRPDPAATP